MKLQFHKLHGLGNDFVLLDPYQPRVELTRDSVRALADRHTGIGFDQLLRLTETDSLLAVDIVNADGSPAEQCGNGMRAIALWLHRQGLLDAPRQLTTAGGTLRLGLAKQTAASGQPQFYVDMPRPQMLEALAPVTTASGQHYTHIIPVLVGNPHLVIACDQPARQRQLDGRELAELDSAATRQWRDGPLAQGCNAGFAKFSANQVELCVWERGAGPTRACGSGACAAAWVAMQKQGLKQVSVTQPGGRLVLEWTPDDALRMTGPASYVYQGEIQWPGPAPHGG